MYSEGVGAGNGNGMHNVTGCLANNTIQVTLYMYRHGWWSGCQLKEIDHMNYDEM